MDWLDLLAVQGTLKSLLQHHSSIIWRSTFFIFQLSHPYMTTGKTIALTRCTFVGRVMSLLFNMLSRLVITFLPRSKRLLISWLQSPSAVILEPPQNQGCPCFHCFPIYLPWSDGTGYHDVSFLNFELCLFKWERVKGHWFKGPRFFFFNYYETSKLQDVAWAIWKLYRQDSESWYQFWCCHWVALRKWSSLWGYWFIEPLSLSAFPNPQRTTGQLSVHGTGRPGTVPGRGVQQL